MYEPDSRDRAQDAVAGFLAWLEVRKQSEKRKTKVRRNVWTRTKEAGGRTQTRILELLAGRPMTTSELAENLGIEREGAWKQIRALSDAGRVRQSGEKGYHGSVYWTVAQGGA